MKDELSEVLINDVLTPRDEIIDEDKEFQDQVNIYDIGSSTGRLENSPKELFDITYPCESLRAIISEIRKAVEGLHSNTGFILTGPYGSGKSHSLLVIHHLFENPEIGNDWSQNSDLIDENPKIPRDANVASVSAAREGKESEYLWIPVFRRLGREEMLKKDDDGYPIPPSVDDLRELAEDSPVAIIIDELHNWYDGLSEGGIRKARNGDFLENLTEAASTPDCPLFVFLSILDQKKEKESWQELMDRLDRTGIQKKRMDFVAEDDKLVRYRLFEREFNEEKAFEIINDYLNLYSGKKLEPSTEEEMLKFYPFHPDLTNLLKRIYGPGGKGEGARRPLRVLANIVKENYKNKSLILVSDLGLENLGSIDPGLRDRWKNDTNKLIDISPEEATPKLIKPVTKTIFFYSLPPEMKGVSEEELMLSLLTPKNPSLDEIKLTLKAVVKNSSFIWKPADKYMFKKDPNVMHTINRKANRIKLESDKRVEKRIRKELENIFGREAKIVNITDIFEKNDLIAELRKEIDRKDKVNVLISPERFQGDKNERNEKLKDLLGKFNWPNSIILFFPRSLSSAYDEKIKIKARRILAEEELTSEQFSDKQINEAKKERKKDIESLRSRLKDRYGAYLKQTLEGSFREKEIQFDGEISTEIVKDKVVGGPDQVSYVVKNNLNDFRNRDVKDIYEMFRKILKYPIIDSWESLYEGLGNLYKKGVIGFESASNYFYHNVEPFPQKEDLWNLTLKSREDITVKVSSGEIKERFSENLDDYLGERFQSALKKMRRFGGKIYLIKRENFTAALKEVYGEGKVALSYQGIYYQPICPFPDTENNWEIISPEKAVNKLLRKKIPEIKNKTVGEIFQVLPSGEKLSEDVVIPSLKVLYRDGEIGLKRDSEYFHTTQKDVPSFDHKATIISAQKALDELQKKTKTEAITESTKVKEILLEEGEFKKKFFENTVYSILEELMEMDPPVSGIDPLSEALKEIYQNKKIGLIKNNESYHPNYQSFPQEIRDMKVVKPESSLPGKIEISIRGKDTTDLQEKIEGSDEILSLNAKFELELGPDNSIEDIENEIKKFSDLKLSEWEAKVKRERI